MTYRGPNRGGGGEHQRVDQQWNGMGRVAHEMGHHTTPVFDSNSIQSVGNLSQTHPRNRPASPLPPISAIGGSAPKGRRGGQIRFDLLTRSGSLEFRSPRSKQQAGWAVDAQPIDRGPCLRLALHRFSLPKTIQASVTSDAVREGQIDWVAPAPIWALLLKHLAAADDEISRSKPVLARGVDKAQPTKLT